MFGRGASQARVARELAVSRMTGHRWYHAWRRKGRRALKAAGRAGRKPRLTRPQWVHIEAALRQGPGAHGFATDLWTLPRIATVIARRTGVHYHPAHVWRLLQGLGWSLQRPTRQARERDEAAIRHWAAGLSLRALSRALAGRSAVPWSGRPFHPKALSRMLDAVADSSVSHTLVS